MRNSTKQDKYSRPRARSAEILGRLAKKGARRGNYAGGPSRLRSMFPSLMRANLNPDIAPINEGEIGPSPQGIPEILRPSAPDNPDTEEAEGEPVQPTPKRHKEDLKPRSSDMFAHLTGEDIPEVVDHTMAYDGHLPPSARKCPIAVRRMIHNAHRNLGHPSN